MASSNTATMRFNERWSSGAPLHTQPFEGPFVIIYPFFPFFFQFGFGFYKTVRRPSLPWCLGTDTFRQEKEKKKHKKPDNYKTKKGHLFFRYAVLLLHPLHF